VKLSYLFLAASMMLSPAVWAQESAPPVQTSGEGFVTGDLLMVHMYDFPDIPGGVSVRVGADGTVHVPYAGTLQAAGKSPDELQVEISDALRARGIVKDPNVTIDVQSAVGMQVTVLGQVVAPHGVPLFGPAPISYILSQVSGLNGLAAHHLTILHKDNEPPTSLDYEPESPSPAVLHTLVRPGDILHVASRGVFFVSGEVSRPGIYTIGGVLSLGQASAASGMDVVKQMTLQEALAQAGGITSIAARSQMRIIRTVDGKREEIIVDQVKLYKGEIADPIIHPNDIIYVPSSYIRSVTNNIFNTALSGLYAAVTVKTF
jgi:polysaccharide biosynthesis/export protein